MFSPRQRTFPGLVLDLTMTQAHLSPALVESILIAMKGLRLGQDIPISQYQRLLGLMASTANMIPMGLLHMRPFPVETISSVFHQLVNPLKSIRAMCRCLLTLSMWKSPRFLCIGSDAGGKLLSQDCDHRLLSHGLENGLKWSPSPGGLGRPTSVLAHKLPREECCISDSEVLPPRPEGLPFVGLDGQHINSLTFHKFTLTYN